MQFLSKPQRETLELHRNDSTIHLENKQAGRAENNVKTRNAGFQNLSEELGWGECVPGVRTWEERGSQPGKIPSLQENSIQNVTTEAFSMNREYLL